MPETRRKLAAAGAAAMVVLSASACSDRDPLDSLGSGASNAVSATNVSGAGGSQGSNGSNGGTAGTDGGSDSAGATDNTPSTTENASADPTTTDTPTTSETGGIGCEAAEGVGGVMSKFGAPCSADDECVALLGEGGVCLDNILELYDLPCGYCTKLCELPPQTAYVPDDAICGVGVTCIGADMYFEACAVECTDDADCPREGYECRVMPTLGQSDDPKFCLMGDEFMV